MKLDYFYFSTFDLKMNATEIFKPILPFSMEKHDRNEVYITRFKEKINYENCSTVGHSSFTAVSSPRAMGRVFETPDILY